MITPQEILHLFKKGTYEPVYFLQGEEVYYIDLLTDYIQEHALDKAEKSFNLNILYGKDHLLESVIAQAQQCPLIGKRQVIIVKEAQELANFNQEAGQTIFKNYLQRPNLSTILVLAYKYKTITTKTKLGTLLTEKAILVTSKKLYDAQLPSWMKQYAAEKGFALTEKATYWLQELVGNNLSRLAKEIDKVILNLASDEPITDATIQTYVGLHKPFNGFDLQQALAGRDVYKSYHFILEVMGTPNSQVVISLLGILCSFFTKLLLYHPIRHKSPREIAEALEINGYFVPQYETAVKHYSVSKIIQNIGFLQEADKQVKGVGYSVMAEVEILKELMYKLLN